MKSQAEKDQEARERQQYNRVQSIGLFGVDSTFSNMQSYISAD